MSFLTPEEVRAVRLRGSIKVKLEGLAKEITVVKMAGDRALEAASMQDDVQTGKKGRKDLFLFILRAACANDAGDLITAEDAEQLLSVLTIEELNALMKKATENTFGASSSGNSPASPVAA